VAASLVGKKRERDGQQQSRKKQLRRSWWQRPSQRKEGTRAEQLKKKEGKRHMTKRGGKKCIGLGPPVKEVARIEWKNI